MTRTPYLLLSLSLLAAGCIGGDADEGVTPAATDEAAATPDAVKTTAPTPTANADATGAPAPTPQEIPVSWEGNFGTGFCAPMGPNACMGTSISGSERFTEVNLRGYESGSLTLTWTASTPAYNTLELYVFSVMSCGDGCFEGTDTVNEGVEGTSPLKLDLGAASLAEGESLAVYVSAPRLTPSPVYGSVSTGQTFQVEGGFLGYP